MHVLLKDNVKKKTDNDNEKLDKDQTVLPDHRQTVKMSNGQINHHRQTVQPSTEKTPHRHGKFAREGKTIEKITDTMNNHCRLNGQNIKVKKMDIT